LSLKPQRELEVTSRSSIIALQRCARDPPEGGNSPAGVIRPADLRVMFGRACRKSRWGRRGAGAVKPLETSSSAGSRVPIADPAGTPFGDCFTEQAPVAFGSSASDPRLSKQGC
jgi:hypothetical protein